MPHSDEDISKKLAAELPDFMPNAPGSDNYKLLSAIGERLKYDGADISDIGKATTLQEALEIEHTLVVKEGETYVIEEGETEYWTDVVVNGDLIVEGELIIYDAMGLEGLRLLGEVMNLEPNEGETAKHYKARLLARFLLLTNEGTISDILHSTSELLDIDKETIQYSEPVGSEYGTVQISVPGQATDNTELTESEIGEVLSGLIAASYRAEPVLRGTFTYITPEDYNNNLHDASLGYDGLDANGDPKNNGGTYAGLVE